MRIWIEIGRPLRRLTGRSRDIRNKVSLKGNRNSSEIRTKLLNEGFDIGSRQIDMYDTKPFPADIRDPSRKVCKINMFLYL